MRGGSLVGIGYTLKGFDHDDDKHVVVDRRAIVDPGPGLSEGSSARAPPPERGITREPRSIARLQRIVDSRHDDAHGPKVRSLLDARLQCIRHSDHGRPAIGAGTCENHSAHLIPRHRTVLHFKPDEIEMLADLTVELRVK